MKIICLTGKKGTGKTTLLNSINQLGNDRIKTFAMDQYINEIYQKNQIGYLKINEAFNGEYNNEFEVDRKKLANAVFNNKEIYQKLMEITIPLMRNQIKFWIKNNLNKTIIIELAIYLKFENEFKDLFDQIILIKDENPIHEKHVSNLLDDSKINADLILIKFDQNNVEKIISWLKTS